MEKYPKRIQFIDISKCIAIFTVIWGHTATNDELLASPMLITKIFYSIHMPLFFFLTGLSITIRPLKAAGEWRFFLKKCILTLLVPYFIWALIFCHFSFENVGRIFYGSWKMLNDASTLSSVWYLLALFIARILVQLLINLADRLNRLQSYAVFAIPASVLMIVSVLLPNFSIGWPWCFNIALAAAAFILFGIVFRGSLIRLQEQKGWLLVTLLLVSCGLYALVVLLRGEHFTILMMCKGSYGELLPALLCAFFGSFSVIFLSMVLGKMQEGRLPGFNLYPLIYIGQHTMGIFLLHKPILQQLIIPFLTGILGDILSLGMLRFIAAVIAFVISVFLCRVIEHYIPELFGIFSKDRIAAGMNGIS